MIRHHVRSFGNNKILAIKLVRELTACGLKEAKDIVEQQLGFFVNADANSQARIAEEAARFGIEFDPLLDGTVASPSVGSSSGSSSGSSGMTEPRGCSVRYVTGSQLIAAIKLVRELTGLGLKESKDLVEQGGLVRTGLSRTEADEIARKFAEIGSRVVVLDGSGGVSGAGGSSGGHRHDYQNEDDYDF